MQVGSTSANLYTPGRAALYIPVQYIKLSTHPGL